MAEHHPFKGRHCEAEMMVLGVRWSLRDALRYRDLEDVRRERGLPLDQITLSRWVQHAAPQLEKRCRPHLNAGHASWKIDEAYINIKTVWMYVYRAVASQGNPLEFLLSPQRDGEAAKRVFLKALGSCTASASHGEASEEAVAQFSPTSGRPMPRVITVDKHAASPNALAERNASGVLPVSVALQKVKEVNTMVEQDHRFLTRLVKPGMGFFSFQTAQRTFQG